MKYNILLLFLCLITLPCFAQYVVEGGNGTPLLAKDDNSVKVYLLNGLSGAKISYTYDSSTYIEHEWYKYKNSYSDKSSVKSRQSGNTSTITDVEDGYGYFVELENTTDVSNHSVWIIDYSRKVPILNSLHIVEDEDQCEFINVLVDVDKDKLKLPYNAPNGDPLQIVRNYKLNYYTMVWNDVSKMFINSLKEENISDDVFEYQDPIEIAPPPLRNTTFTLSGDQFAKHFNIEEQIESKEYEAIAVKAEVLIDTLFTSSDNEMTGTTENFSAPAGFTFTAYANEPVATFYIWKVYNLDKSVTNPVSQTATKILNYTFEDAGHYRVDLEVSNYQSTCTEKITYDNIIISDFMLWVPNAFSPTTSPGINDVFKVAYKSIITFKGWIFNRWGNELFHWTDPSQGWDGKYRGKYVPPGTYFYVIEATGADGKRHVKKGDVNIVGGK